MWILIVTILYGANTPTSIPGFISKESCELAAAQTRANTADNWPKTRDSLKIVTICVKA